MRKLQVTRREVSRMKKLAGITSLHESSAKERLKKKMRDFIPLRDIIHRPPKEILRALTRNGFGRNLEYVEISKRSRERIENLGHIVLDVDNSDVEGDVTFILLTERNVYTVPVGIEASPEQDIPFEIDTEDVVRYISRVVPDLPREQELVFGSYMANVINDMLAYRFDW